MAPLTALPLLQNPSQDPTMGQSAKLDQHHTLSRVVQSVQ